MGFLDSIENLFSGGQMQGYGDMMGYLGQIPGMYDQLNPYIDASKGMLPGYENTLSQLQNGSYLNNAMKGYYQSPLYQNQMNAAMNAANQSAAAGGTLGTTGAQQAAERSAQALSSQDQNNYIQNLMQGTGMGLSGAQGLIGMGNQDQQFKTQGLAENMQNMGSMKYGQDVSQASGMNGMFNFLGNGLANVATGGTYGAMGGNSSVMPQGSQGGFLNAIGRGLNDFGYGNQGRYPQMQNQQFMPDFSNYQTPDYANQDYKNLYGDYQYPGTFG